MLFNFIALTFVERPYKVINPSASWWSYKSPVEKLAIPSSYKEYGEAVPSLIIFPLYNLNLVVPLTTSWVLLTNADKASRNG